MRNYGCTSIGLNGNPVGRVILRREPGSSGEKRVQIVGLAADAVYRLLRDPIPAALLYWIEPRDLATLVGSILVLAFVAAFAGWLPARRAARVDPAEVLRES
jgi:hypothetical protein